MTQEEVIQILKSLPSGWHWDGLHRFEARSGANAFMRDYLHRQTHEEAKIIKRGGSTNPYYYMVARRKVPTDSLSQ